MIKKYVIGTVVQVFNEDGVCLGQDFIASDFPIEYDFEDCDEEDIETEKLYFPYEMIQPL